MRLKIVLIGLVIGLASFAHSQAVAQSQDKSKEDTNTRSVQGVVSDASGNPVNGAVVQLKDTRTLQIRSFIAKSDGAYHFTGLSTNVDYELHAEHNGSTSGTKRLDVFDSRKAAVLNLKLK